ncbi:thioredoxin family protein [Olivibacter sp. XZL3]|uniref:thioredoxin family protein n=1 Tax=Olivibacter sp. XZL3 TaxID=1735116 RepID=UPI0010646EF3|nr:thioredoxin family protein [Olivibacter sp. XZL3]
MKISITKPLLILICFLLATACQHRKQQQDEQGSANKQDYTYTPEKGALVVISETANPEMNKVSLFKDNEKDSITSMAAENGKFKLQLDTANLHEVYFIKIEGKSTKRGTSGLAWEAVVPVLAVPSTTLELVQKPFNHAGSISKVAFSIQGGGEEQALLNDWHTALATLEAEDEGQVQQYAIGGAGVTKVAGKKQLAKTPGSITEDFIGKQKPLISSFYLLSRAGKERQYAKEYQNVLEQAPDPVKRSKYGLDFAKRLALLQTKVKQLDLEKEVVATDVRLSEIPWDSFKDRKYLLLSFWNSADQASASAVKQLEKAAPDLAEKGIDILPISMESQFSKWKENVKSFDFKHNYRMRNEAQQDLINTLYLSDLPRFVLVKPNGEVIDDDFNIEQLEELE